VSYTIIHIFIKSSSNEIKSLIVVFIPLYLTLGSVVERHRDHIRVLHDLPDGSTLAQKIAASLVFSVTKILAIETHKLYCIFLYITVRSQSLLKPTSDQTISDTN
jgi:inner membrane protein involved in colicin E2 resistance